MERDTLKGLGAIGVVIDVLPPELPREGVTDAMLRARLIAKLSAAGFVIGDSSRAFAGLRLIAVRDTRGPYAVAVTLGLYQPAILSRDPGLRTVPETWSADTILMAQPKILPQAALDSVDDLAARLAAAWREANHK